MRRDSHWVLHRQKTESQFQGCTGGRGKKTCGQIPAVIWLGLCAFSTHFAGEICGGRGQTKMRSEREEGQAGATSHSNVQRQMSRDACQSPLSLGRPLWRLFVYLWILVFTCFWGQCPVWQVFSLPFPNRK